MTSSTTLPPRTIKRILHDLSELERNPIPGISLCMPDHNQPFLLHGNLVINVGAYKGLLIHLILRIPSDFPLSPPAAHIAPSLGFNHQFHHHIYDDPKGNTICNNLVSNFGMFGHIDEFGKPERSGWIAAYTLGSLMLQLQVFFADPDYNQENLPSEELVQGLREHINKYELDITVSNEIEDRIVKHSFDNPYPALSSFTEGSEAKQFSGQKLEGIPEDKATSEANSNQTRSQSHTTSNKTSEEDGLQKNEEDKICEWEKPLKKISKADLSYTNNSTPLSIKKLVCLLISRQIDLLNKSKISDEGEPQKSEEDKFGEGRLQKSKESKTWEWERSIKKVSKTTLPSTNQPSISHITKPKQTLISSYLGVDRSADKSTVPTKESISSKVFCAISKSNLLDSGEPTFGYLIDVLNNPSQLAVLRPLTEVISFDAFMLNFPGPDQPIYMSCSQKFLSGLRLEYVVWLPMYIDDPHFERSKHHFLI